MTNGVPKDLCPGSRSFPTTYDGEHTQCPECRRKLKLHVNGKLPNHNRQAER